MEKKFFMIAYMSLWKLLMMYNMNAFTIENCRSLINATKSVPPIEFSFPSSTEVNIKLMQNPLYDPFYPPFEMMQ